MRKAVAAAKMVFMVTFIMLYIVAGMPVLVYCRLTKRPKMALYVTWLLDRVVLWMSGISVAAEGLEKVPKGQGCIYIGGNHRSLLDTLVTYRILPGDLRFLAKKELFSIPLVSFAMKTMGMI